MNANSKEVSTENLVADIRQTVKEYLDDQSAAFYEKADTAIFELGNEASNNQEQKQYFELLQAIRDEKPLIVNSLPKAFAVFLKPISDQQSGNDVDLNEDDDELSLVSQDTMEEMVLINGIVARTFDKFSESIAKLEIRLSHLAEQSSTIFAEDALSPMNFCTSFKDTIASLDVTIENKLILYKLFENEISSQLNELYDQLNNQLIEAGILPKIKLHQTAPIKSSDSRPERPQYEIIEDEPEEPGSVEDYEGVSAGGPGGSGGASAGGLSSAAGGESDGPAVAPVSDYMTADNMAASTAPQGGASAPVGNSEQPAAAPADGDTPATGRQIGGHPVDQINRVISDYIGRSDPSAGGAYQGNAQFYGHQDVLSALTTMQAEVSNLAIDEEPVIEKIDADQIKQALISTIASKQGGTVTKQVDKVIEKTIDFIKLIFDAIIEDQNISDTIKTILLRLQIPVIKASMIDHEFFIDDEHPARLLLDRIAELGVGVTTHEDEIYKQINEIVRVLLEEYVEDINAFVVALEKIEAIITQRAEEAEERERAAQLEIQKIHARKIVLMELRKSTYGKKLPAAVHMLVLKLWPTLMFNHYLNHGKENDEWITQVTIMHELIESLQPPTNDEMYDNLQKNYIPITVRIEKHLDRHRSLKGYKDEVIEKLRSTYEELISNYVPLEQPEQQAAIEAPEASNDAKADSSVELDSEEQEVQQTITPVIYEVDADEIVHQKDKLKLLPPEVRPGVWFQLKMENDRTRRLKLSIVVIDEALLVFVDHDGNRVIEKEADEFVEDLKQGDASIIMSHSVFDHALASAYEVIK